MTKNMTRKKMWIDTVDILKPLSDIEGTENISIEWLYPFKDDYGNTKDQRIMLLHFNKETLSKINWSGFNKDDIPNVADEYFEHPALSK